MSTRRFPKPRILTGLTLLLLTILPAAAPTRAQTTVDTGTGTVTSAPERVLDRADLLPHLETIRRQYPRLHERLRREVPPDQWQQALAESAAPTTTTTAGKTGGARSATATTATAQGRTGTARSVPIDALLRQDVRVRAAPPAPLPGTPAGGAR